MSATVRSPKIPLSPSSPPETGVKRRRTSETSPKLPPSPQHMSVATKSYVSYGTHTSHMDEAASRSSPGSPSSPSLYTRPSTQRNSQPYSTPASTHSEAPKSNMNDLDQHRDKRQRTGDPTEVDRSIQPTNHRRLKKEEEGATPNMDDIEMQDTTGNPDLDELEKDMGEPFLLCRSRVLPQEPDVRKHLLSIYGLERLQQSVARLDPLTGEKINKLRKSYDGQIKDFSLAGRNKSVNLRKDRPGAESMRETIGSFHSEMKGTWLETNEEWAAKHEKHRIGMTDDFRSKLRRAMQMQPGRVRDEPKWDDVLGHAKKPIGPPLTAANPAAAQRPNGVVRGAAQNAADLKRQTRGKKRSYGDDSFIGYGEGYSDPEDNDQDGEYGSDDGGRRKRRKNESFSGQALGR